MCNLFVTLSLCLGLVAGVITPKRVDALTPTNASVQPFAPNEAGGPIDPAFAGFAFEERSFYYYFGTPDNPNTFSRNLVNAIAERTKTQPIIRVGGTSLDHSKYDPHQSDPVHVPKDEQNQGIPKNLVLGPSYFDTFATLPNAQFIIDIPFATNNLANSKQFAKKAYNQIDPSNIFAFEIGNESIPKYIKQWINWSREILDTLGLPDDSKIYQAVSLSSEEGPNFLPGDPSSAWKIPNIFKQGLNETESRIKSVSMHYYQTKAHEESSLQADIMNHGHIVRGSKFIRNAIKYLNKQKPPIPLALAEVGNALGNSSNNSPLQNVLGDSLWMADFFLYSMSINVSRINYQSGLTFPFSLWNPAYNNTPAGVHAAFYGQMFAADFIGSAQDVRVMSIDLKDNFLTTYTAYDNEKLARIAINNMRLCSNDLNSASSRPSRKVTLSIGDDAKSVEIKRLTSPFGGTATTAQNITWGSVNDTVTLLLNDGIMSVEVDASEAIIASIQY
ncbi:hypothetical protein F5884DRAFT_833299 [Xylogone sp. PMI_703]|nr:hypothetical protein F5884DRAFT_833299 [Xylogone sp. PMI_703]